MKRSIYTVFIVAVCGCFCQPSRCSEQFQTYGFVNRTSTLDAPVFDSMGVRLSGTNYVAVLYGGPAPDDLQLAKAFPGDPTPMPPVPFTYMPSGMAGYFRYDFGIVELQNVSCSELPWLQVRAWDARLGSSYEEVAALDLGGYGESSLFRLRGGLQPPCVSNSTVPSTLHGLESFALREVIPEPSSTLLLLLGLPALLFFRRRRSQ